MTNLEIQPLKASEAAEGSEKAESQKLDDATLEPGAYIEESGDYKQSESIQTNFSAVMEGAAAGARTQSSAGTESEVPEAATSQPSGGRGEAAPADVRTNARGESSAMKVAEGAQSAASRGLKTADGEMPMNLRPPKNPAGAPPSPPPTDAGGMSEPERVMWALMLTNPANAAANQARGMESTSKTDPVTGTVTTTTTYTDGSPTEIELTPGELDSGSVVEGKNDPNENFLEDGISIKSEDLDGDGKIDTVTTTSLDGTVTGSFYDADGNLVGGSWSPNGGQDTMYFKYDENGNMIDDDGTSIILPESSSGGNSGSSSGNDTNNDSGNTSSGSGNSGDDNRGSDNSGSNDNSNPDDNNPDEGSPEGGDEGGGGGDGTEDGEDDSGHGTHGVMPKGGGGESGSSGGGGEQDDSGHLAGLKGGSGGSGGSSGAGGDDSGDDSGHPSGKFGGGVGKILSDNQPGAVDPIGPAGNITGSSGDKLNSANIKRQTGKV